MMNSCACSKHSLFYILLLQEKQICTEVYHYTISLAHRKLRLGNAQLCLMQQKAIYELWLDTQYARSCSNQILLQICWPGTDEVFTCNS